ncbi:MAG: GspE/PulE family protein [Patescibacteria group bacterium]
MAFLDHLVEKGVLKKSDADNIAQDIESGSDIDSALTARGIDTKEVLNQKSAYFNIPVRELGGAAVSAELLQNVPEESAAYYKFVPIGMEDGVLEIGVLDPDNIGARDAIQFISGKLEAPYKLFLISRDDFLAAIEQYKGATGEVNRAISDLETELSGKVKDIKIESQYGSDEDLIKKSGDTHIIEEAPITKIVAVILRHAIEGRASDIHIEPTADKVRVRFRVDGVMFTSLTLPSKVHSAIIARVKILTNLRLDEKRKPQDGRFGTHVDGKSVDFRVSTFPTYYGEKVEIRVLDQAIGIQKLEGLGLSEENAAAVREAIKKPYGMILLTGPTGSGKTTTLYSMLNELDRESMNVVSLEDPVEYNVPGISQSQVHPEIGYTFATGLRSILRQDPDVIMVGEIRDKETAQLAIQAALTGHLVFSTLHTNNAAGVVPRLVDMGVDPYLIAPTLILSIAQRLVKTLCEEGGEEHPVDEAIKMMIAQHIADLPENRKKVFLSAQKVYRPKPSQSCPSGLRGRIAVFEAMPITPAIEQVILTKPVEEEVYKIARQQGMITMKEDALLKAFAGKIPFEQVNEVE